MSCSPLGQSAARYLVVFSVSLYSICSALLEPFWIGSKTTTLWVSLINGFPLVQVGPTDKIWDNLLNLNFRRARNTFTSMPPNVICDILNTYPLFEMQILLSSVNVFAKSDTPQSKTHLHIISFVLTNLQHRPETNTFPFVSPSMYNLPVFLH